ncbi:glutamine amidotransferase-related protein [Paraburkholderia sp. SIMBA_054]|uniref:glutamine amidotransferase-related protein n=1 Tax=Paraburkholderia TaxID=1822464 RepID=UPI00397B87C7
MPIFGVCYGHQLMAHALGMRSLLSPKRSIVRMPDDSLMPADGASFLPAPGKFAPASFASAGQLSDIRRRRPAPLEPRSGHAVSGGFHFPQCPQCPQQKKQTVTSVLA